MTGDQIVVALLVTFFVGFIVYLAVRSRREDRAAKLAAAGSSPISLPKIEVTPAKESKPLRKAS